MARQRQRSSAGRAPSSLERVGLRPFGGAGSARTATWPRRSRLGYKSKVAMVVLVRGRGGHRDRQNLHSEHDKSAVPPWAAGRPPHPGHRTRAACRSAGRLVGEGSRPLRVSDQVPVSVSEQGRGGSGPAAICRQILRDRFPPTFQAASSVAQPADRTLPCRSTYVLGNLSKSSDLGGPNMPNPGDDLAHPDLLLVKWHAPRTGRR